MRHQRSEDPKIEYSPLCKDAVEDGCSVSVLIYRIAGEGAGWVLEVVDRRLGSTLWEDAFNSDAEAYQAFCEGAHASG